MARLTVPAGPAVSPGWDCSRRCARQPSSGASSPTPRTERRTVSFSVTRDGKIVGFTLTNVELYCRTANPGDYPGNYTLSTKRVTITHGAMPMTGKSSKWPQGKKFEFHDPFSPYDGAGEGGDFTGKLGDLLGGPTHDQILPGKKSMLGEVAYIITNGPIPPNVNTPWAVGTEACDTGGPTGRSLLDWRAKKAGTPGIPVPSRAR
jgi:hypothetical protein